MPTKPIIFSTDMVKAILKGYKTQTRRITKYQESDINILKENILFLGKYKINDILYVRETFSPYANNTYVYKADYKNVNDKKWQGKWKPSIFMPKIAARLFLRITNVRVERLQDISGDDCHAEGMRIFSQAEDTEDPYYDVPAYWKNPDGKFIKRLWVDNIYDAFFHLWDSINYKRGYGWETNPFVFAYNFVIHDKKSIYT